MIIGCCNGTNQLTELNNDNKKYLKKKNNHEIKSIRLKSSETVWRTAAVCKYLLEKNQIHTSPSSFCVHCPVGDFFFYRNGNKRIRNDNDNDNQSCQLKRPLCTHIRLGKQCVVSNQRMSK